MWLIIVSILAILVTVILGSLVAMIIWKSKGNTR